MKHHSIAVCTVRERTGWSPSKMENREKSKRSRWGLRCLIACGFVMVAFVGIPLLFQGGNGTQRHVCTAQLSQIQGAKEQWALEWRKGASDPVAPADIAHYLKSSQVPECPEGGRYALGTAGTELPTCRVGVHTVFFLDGWLSSLTGETNQGMPPFYLRDLPPELRSRSFCRTQLQLLDAAKRHWANLYRRKSGETPSLDELLHLEIGPESGGRNALKFLELKRPVCPAGGVYTLGSVGVAPRCSVPGHTLGEAVKP